MSPLLRAVSSRLIAPEYGSKSKASDRFSRAFNYELMGEFPEFANKRSSFADKYQFINRMDEVFNPRTKSQDYNVNRPYQFLSGLAKNGFTEKDSKFLAELDAAFPGYLDPLKKAHQSILNIESEQSSALERIFGERIHTELFR